MSSNIRLTRICAHCQQPFEAKTTTTKCCSDRCAKRAYKARKRLESIAASNKETRRVIEKPIIDLQTQQFLTVDECARLVRVSRRTLYRLHERGELPFKKLSRRTVICRSDLDQLFASPPPVSRPPVAIPLSDCYTIKEVLTRFSISNKGLHELIRRNAIPKQKSGRYAYVPKAQIESLLAPPFQE